MTRFLLISLISIVVLAVVYVGVALLMIFRPEPTFNVGPFPATQFSSAKFEEQQYQMRDGETLFARRFPVDSADTILLLHGVTADGRAFNPSALELQQLSGAEVIALDLRGHGRSGGEAGDIDYIGQYQDDVADVISAIQAEKPNGRIILGGHSMGGGITLQFAMLDNRPAVDGYLMFAPHLGSDSPTNPQPTPEQAEAAADYSQLHVPRLIGSIMLNSVGVKAFHHLDTLFFNLTDNVTHTYSFRATANSAPQAHAAALAAIDAPMLVVVGSNDEAFVAAEYPATISAHGNGEVHIINGANHNSILTSSETLTIIDDWLGETAILD